MKRARRAVRIVLLAGLLIGLLGIGSRISRLSEELREATGGASSTASTMR